MNSNLNKPPVPPKLSKKDIDSLTSGENTTRDDLKEMDEGLALMRDSKYYDDKLIERDMGTFQNALKERGVKEEIDKPKEKEEVSSKIEEAEENPKEPEKKDDDAEKLNQTDSNLSIEETIVLAKDEKRKVEKLTQDEVMLAEAGNKNDSEPNKKEKSQEKKESEGFGLSAEAELLKNDAEGLFEKVLESQADLQRINNNRSAFTKISRFFNAKDQESGNINNDYDLAKNQLESAKQAYREKFQEFADEIVKEKRETLETQKGTNETLSGKIKDFVLTEKIIGGFSKSEKGEKTPEKLTLFEYIKKNEKELAKRREEVLSEKKKGLFKKAMEKYSKLSKTQKMVISFGISTTVGAGVVLTGGAGISAALGYGAFKGSKTVIRRLTTGALAGTGTMLVNKGTLDFNKKREEALNRKTGEKVAENLGSDMFKYLDQYNKTIQKRERNRKIFVGAAAAAFFGTALGIEALASGEIGDVIDHHSTEAGGVVTGKIHTMPEPEVDHINPVLSENEINPVIEPEIKPSVDLGGDLNSQAVDAGIPDTPVSAGEGVEATLAQKSTEILDTKEQLLNHSFELKAGGNVWNNLSDHFDGNKQAVGKALAGFRAETMKDLIDNHGMSQAQANDFIEWRFGHMRAGVDNFALDNGKLKIPGFDSDKMINQFNVNNPAVDSVDQQILEQANQDQINRVSELPKKDEVYNQAMQDINDRSSYVDNYSGVERGENVIDFPNGSETGSQVDRIINQKVAEIYENWGKDQIEEWDEMKLKNARDIFDGEYGKPLGNGLDGAEINNREQLRDYLIDLERSTDVHPSATETVEGYVRRAEGAKLDLAA